MQALFRYYFFIFFMHAALSICAADKIIVHNHTTQNLYGAVYYSVRGKPAVRAGNVYIFPHGHTVTMPRPPRKFYQYGIYDRDLYFSENRANLTPQLPRGALASVNVGTSHGTHYHLHDHGGVLYGYNSLMWSLHTVYDGVGSLIDESLEPLREQYMQHPYAQEVATIRTGTALCEQEGVYVEARAYSAACAFKKLGVEGSVMPRVALCTSGGGYRALIATLGALKALEEAGVRDICLYHSALSGSSWALASLLHSNMSVSEFSEHIKAKICSGFFENNNNEQVSQALLKQYVFTQAVSATDFYGALIAQKLLCTPHVVNPNALDVCDHATCLAPETAPMPLYSAVSPLKNNSLEWIEFTPYEVGSVAMKSFIPFWAFGRTFFEGSSRDFDPPQALGFCLGIWGSGMSANIKELVSVYQQRISSPLVLKALEAVVAIAPFTNDRIYPAHVANWNLGTPLPYNMQERLTLVDAGIAFALPLPPLLRAERPVDIIIVLDMAYNPIVGTELKKADAYAQEHKLPFPLVDYSKVSELCSVHYGEPTIIYMPLVKNKNYKNGWDPRAADFTATFNFKYTREQYDLVHGLAEYNMQESIPMILDVLQQWCVQNSEG